MSKVCGECRYIDLCDIVDGKALCTEKKERRFANSLEAESCSRFWKKWIYDTETANAIKAADEYTKPSCFITTAIVDILGFADDCEALEILRWFREDVLQVLPEYRDILMKYDTVGPILASSLAHDENRVSIARTLYKVFIKGCVNYIQIGDFDRAIVLYKDMVESLINKYMPGVFVPEEFKKHYDQSSGGHGYMK